MTADITVVIPTRGQPGFLNTLLASIRAQTARDRIAEVVISEDGGGRESKNVVDRYPDLPIRYIYRDTPLGFLGAHRELLCHEAKRPLTALVHHDDWWSRDHLEIACHALERNPKCSAFFSSVYDTCGPEYPPEIKFHNGVWRAWVAGGCSAAEELIVLDIVDALLASLIEVTFHFSSAVGRSQALAEAFQKVEATQNGYDCDRTFPVFLAEQGSLCFSMHPTVFIRMHPGQESKRIQSALDCLLFKANTIRWMCKQWPAEVRAAAIKFNKLALGMDTSILGYISRMTGETLRSCLIDECGFNLIREERPARFKWILKQLIPPALVALRHRISANTKK